MTCVCMCLSELQWCGLHWVGDCQCYYGIFCSIYITLWYLVMFLVGSNNSAIWSCLLVEMDNCTFGSLWPLDWFLMLLLLLYERFDFNCLLRGLFLGHLAGVWLSKFMAYCISIAYWLITIFYKMWAVTIHGRVPYCFDYHFVYYKCS